MLSKQEIRKNRQKLRRVMIASQLLNVYLQNQENNNFRDNEQCGKSDYQKSSQTIDSTAIKRNQTEEFRFNQSLTDLKDVYNSKSFNELYNLGQKIGEGVESVVYKCTEKKTNQQYAVKIIRSNQVQTINRLKQTFRITKTLKNRRVIKGHYLFINQKESTNHILYQLCNYPSLREHMKRELKMKQSHACAIIQEIILGASYLHSNGVCHRDLKPDNIMYNQKTGQIKLIDFQIAKMKKYQHQKLEMWTVTGTLHYKAPQMFLGQYDQKIDAWAIGVITFQLLTGKLPFYSSYQHQIIKMIQQNNIRYDKYGLSTSAEAFLKGLLQKDPEKRWTVQQALSSSFILKNTDLSSTTSNSPKLRHTNSLQNKQKKQRRLTVDLTGKSFRIQSILQQKDIIDKDIGIRLCQ